MFSRQAKFAVLFDLDGTLVDSKPYWMQSEVELAEAHNGTWTEEDGLGVVGMSLDESSELMKRKIGINLEPQEIVDQLTNSVQNKLAEEIPWRPGAKELLIELRRNKVKTALVTMSLRRMAQQVVDSIDFDAFDVIVAGDDVRNGKPHPEAFLKAAELLGFHPGSCIAFEDSSFGIASAEAAGTLAIGIPHIVPIPEKEGRVLLPTLEGITYKQLKRMIRR